MKYVIDIQDPWPEPFCIKIRNKLFRKVLYPPLAKYADAVYRKADGVVAVSETYLKWAAQFNHSADLWLSVFLGKDSALFDQYRKENAFQRNDNELWIAYVGSLSHSYDLPTVINALALLSQRQGDGLPPVRLIVMGDGQLRPQYEAYAKAHGIAAEFTGMLPYPKMVGRLCACDICVNPIIKSNRGSIINKVSDYAFSGLPVVNSQNCDEYRQMIERYGCGLNCECENSEEMADAIRKLAADANLRRTMGANSRRMGEECFDRRRIYPHIVDALAGYGAKKVMIVANFHPTLNGSTEGRFTYLAQMLHERGFDVELVVSDFEHRTRKRRESLSNPYPFKLTYLHEPGYSNIVSVRRMWSHYVWGCNVGKYLKSCKDKPDVVYVSVPSLTAARKVSFICKNK